MLLGITGFSKERQCIPGTWDIVRCHKSLKGFCRQLIGKLTVAYAKFCMFCRHLSMFWGFFFLTQTIHTFFKCYPGGGISFLLLNILQGASSKPQTQTHQACLFSITIEPAGLLLFFSSITVSRPINSRKKSKTSHFTFNCTRQQRVKLKVE